MLTKKELLERRNYIGASDVPAILGVSQYKTALDVYRDKIGENTIDMSVVPGSPLDRGNRCEAEILKQYSHQIRHRLRTIKKTYRHNDYKFMRATPDAYDAKLNEAIEVKTTINRTAWGKASSTHIPIWYWPQVAFQAAITNASRIAIPVMFFPFAIEQRLENQAHARRCKVTDLDYTLFSYEFSVFYYERNLEQEEKIIAVVKNFWENHVMMRIPPESTTLEDMKYQYPRSVPKQSIIANETVLNNCKRYSQILRIEKGLEKLKDVVALKIKKYIGENEALIDNNNNIRATWKSYSKNGLDVKLLKMRHPIIAKRFTYENEFRRLIMKRER